MPKKSSSGSSPTQAHAGGVSKKQDPPKSPEAADTTLNQGATPEEVATEAFGWTKGDPPPEPVRYDHAWAERAHVDGKDYYRIVKTTGGSFIYDSQW